MIRLTKSDEPCEYIADELSDIDDLPKSPTLLKAGSKCMVIEAFDKKLYATVEDSIFSLEEIPEIQLKSENGLRRAEKKGVKND